MGRKGIHPAVFVRVANKGVRAYVKWKSAEVLEDKRNKEKDNAETESAEFSRRPRTRAYHPGCVV
jgi:hypothetical protein